MDERDMASDGTMPDDSSRDRRLTEADRAAEAITSVEAPIAADDEVDDATDESGMGRGGD